jgi:hypothetical protein
MAFMSDSICISVGFRAWLQKSFVVIMLSNLRSSKSLGSRQDSSFVGGAGSLPMRHRQIKGLKQLSSNDKQPK